MIWYLLLLWGGQGDWSGGADGAHRWILHDSLDECGEADEVLLEMKDQFCAGIQCKRLVLEYIPLILVKSQKFLETTTDVCSAIHACKRGTQASMETMLLSAS